MQNEFVESFNGRFREECLNAQVFQNLTHARWLIERFRQKYSQERPHGSLGGIAPEEFERRNNREENLLRTGT